ncbi:MAG TPA: NUDIX hydrolase [Candidatus Cybelea sp.]|nr:NUDIX hydrolase [Candidatus Cybelea sp.]
MNESVFKGPAVRPRDAATLILYRKSREAVEILMGERHGGHSFMPNRYVFPGGRVDVSDWRVRAAGELRPAVARRLAVAATPTRARALAAAAIRETFEETGLVVGRSDPRPHLAVPENWRAFFSMGYAPALDVLDYAVRAVTPPYRPKRFNARFFVADAGHAEGTLKGSGELLDLRWIPVADALKLELPSITAVVLQQIATLIDRRPGEDRPVKLYRYLRGKHTYGEE